MRFQGFPVVKTLLRNEVLKGTQPSFVAPSMFPGFRCALPPISLFRLTSGEKMQPINARQYDGRIIIPGCGWTKTTFREYSSKLRVPHFAWRVLPAISVHHCRGCPDVALTSTQSTVCCHACRRPRMTASGEMSPTRGSVGSECHVVVTSLSTPSKERPGRPETGTVL